MLYPAGPFVQPEEVRSVAVAQDPGGGADGT